MADVILPNTGILKPHVGPGGTGNWGDKLNINWQELDDRFALTPPAAQVAGAGDPGTSDNVARADHVHPLDFSGGSIPDDSIPYAKLDLTGQIVDADVAVAAAIAYTKLALTGSITNADLAGAIALSKLATLTADRALISDGSGVISTSGVTAAEIAFLSGVTSAIQTQLNGKASLALNNLAATAINVALNPTSDNALDLGSTSTMWREAFFGTGIRLKETGGGSDYYSVKAPASIPGNLNLILPPTAGTLGQSLLTDGSGNTSWGDVAPATGVSKNILVNGGMEFWQRNTTFTSPADNQLLLDRWVMNRGGTPTFTVSREATAANVDSGSYSCKIDVTVVGGAANIFLSTRVENGEGLYKGKTVSVSIRVKASAAGIIRMIVTDGATSVTSSANVGTSWETLTATHLVSNSASTLEIYVGHFAALAGVTVSTVYLDSAMMVLGSTPVTFVPTDFGIELAQCQRFFEKSYFHSTPVGTNTPTNVQSFISSPVGASEVWAVARSFMVEKRSTPTITLYRQDGTVSSYSRTSTAGATANETVYAQQISTKGFGIGCNVSNKPYSEGHWTASAEY